MNTPPPIRILRPGTFADIHGTTVSFGAAELQEIADSYDPVSDPAPLVAGHPKHDDPAQGWVGSLAVEDGELHAQPADVEPSFAEQVRAKRYRKVSASFYPPKHPANPKPGKWYLKHVGFLGAMAPAIKGLGTVSFSEADDQASITIDLSEENSMPDTPTPEELEALAIALAEREAEIAEREAAIARRDQEAAAAAAAALHTANVSFAEQLIERALLAPRAKDLVITLQDQLEASTTIAFGEGDDAPHLTPLAAFRSLFDTAHPIVALGEHARADTTVTGDEDPAKLAARAVSFAESERAAGRVITIQAAVRHVQNDVQA